MDFTYFVKSFSEALELESTIELNDSTIFKELSEWDSFSFLALMGMIDSEFSITIKPDEIANTVTLGDLYSLIISKKSS